MSLNSITSAERVHIAFFGLRNAGKSSLVNAVTGQNLSLVSNVLGTTTDPVKKAMELLPLGPVVIIDTPGFDDDGELGLMRVESAKAVLTHTDIVVLVVDATTGKTKNHRAFAACILTGCRQKENQNIFRRYETTRRPGTRPFQNRRHLLD